jgi:hypothetical protein
MKFNNHQQHSRFRSRDQSTTSVPKIKPDQHMAVQGSISAPISI